MDIHALGEFGLIDLIDIPHPNPETVYIGIGDDCAVLPYNDTYYQLSSCDLLVEDIHFIRNKISPYQLGYKAVAVNLSDIAAMGGTPTHILLSAALPPNYTVKEWQELYRGIGDICNRYGVNLIGGDTTASPDKLTLNVTVLGLVEKQYLHLRRDAKPEDVVFVTGPLGGSRAGLELVLNDKIIVSDKIRAKLTQCHCQPEPCCHEIAILNQIAGAHLHALNDISDGLVSESHEIAKASNCGLVLYAEQIPVCAEAKHLAEQLTLDSLQWALTGGEEYQLIGTMDGANADTICAVYQAQTGKQIYIVGAVIEGEGVYLQDGEELRPIDKKGYNHFQNENSKDSQDNPFNGVQNNNYEEAMYLPDSSVESSIDNDVVQLLLTQVSELNRQIEAQKVYRHDLKNHLGCIHGLLECGDNEQALQYLQQLLKASPQSNIKQYHNRTILNILCNQKAVVAEARNIEFQFHSLEEQDLLEFIPDYDLCTLVGNLLDNGIEHAGEQDPYLYMDLFADEAGNIVLRMENSCHTPPILRNGIFISCKPDASSHGKGMEQIRQIAEQYQGIVSWKFDAVEERFITQCLFEK